MSSACDASLQGGERVEGMYFSAEETRFGILNYSGAIVSSQIVEDSVIGFSFSNDSH